jgi:hypothetical protein
VKVGDAVRRRGEYGGVRWFVEPKPGWLRAFVYWPNDDHSQELDGWFGGSEQFVDVDKLEVVPTVVVDSDGATELVSAGAGAIWGVRVDGVVTWHHTERDARRAFKPPPPEPTTPRQGSLF